MIIPKSKYGGILLSLLNLHIPHAEFYRLFKMRKHSKIDVEDEEVFWARKRLLLEDDYDLSKLKENIRLCEDMPQLILQLYIIGCKNRVSANAFYAILTSFLSVVILGVHLKVNKLGRFKSVKIPQETDRPENSPYNLLVRFLNLFKRFFDRTLTFTELKKGKHRIHRTIRSYHPFPSSYEFDIDLIIYALY